MSSKDGSGPLKRKRLNDSAGLHIMMTSMGYKTGEGLGAASQGRVEPIQTEMKNDRAGLGAKKKTNLRDATTGEFPRGPNAWTPDFETESNPLAADGDRVFNWSRWDSTVQDATLLARQSIRDLILSPASPDARGPAVVDMRSQIRYCKKELLHEMLKYKDCLDNLERQRLLQARFRANQYETIKNAIFMNRAAMKMANMDSLTQGRFSQAVPQHEMLYFADICAGPGGFSEYLTWRRCNPFPTDRFGPDSLTRNIDGDIMSASETSLVEPAKAPPAQFPRVKGYGLTLKGDCDFKLHEFLAGPVETFYPFYGPTPKSDGDITSWANLASFAKLIHDNTDGAGVHIAMADGGFDVSDGYSLQEVKSKQLYLCQCLCALTILRPGGVFVVKLFDVFSDFSVDLIYLMSHVFQKISFLKPVTSRPANSERYLLCDGLLHFNAGMAGCPAAPKAAASSATPKPACRDSSTNPQARKFKTPGSAARRHHEDQTASCRFGDGADAGGIGAADYLVDASSALGLLIGHLLDVNAELSKRHPTDKNDDADDVLRLVCDDGLMADTRFKEFIVKVNEEITVSQSIHLSKLLSFAQDPVLTDSRQEDIAKRCLKKWALPNCSREKLPWPLWDSNMSELIRNIVGTPQGGKPFQMNSVKPFLDRSPDVLHFTEEDLGRRNFTPDALLAVAVATPIKESSIMMVFSRGCSTLVSTLEYTQDCLVWKKIADAFERPPLNPRLPAGTLVWALPTLVYKERGGVRKFALTILDVACIYGTDVRSLPYRQRMERAREMSRCINFPHTDYASCVVPELVPLRDLQQFLTSLPKGNCKDRPEVGAMLPVGEGGLGVPKTIFLVHHLSDPWVELRSRSTSRPYYFNRQSKVSTYELPDAKAALPFSETRFFKVDWTAESPGILDVHKLAAAVINLGD